MAHDEPLALQFTEHSEQTSIVHLCGKVRANIRTVQQDTQDPAAHLKVLGLSMSLLYHRLPAIQAVEENPFAELEYNDVQ